MQEFISPLEWIPLPPGEGRSSDHPFDPLRRGFLLPKQESPERRRAGGGWRRGTHGMGGGEALDLSPGNEALLLVFE